MSDYENSKVSELNEILSTIGKTSNDDFKIHGVDEPLPSSSSDSIQCKDDNDKLICQEQQKKEELVVVEGEEEEEYVIQNSYGIYNWARFQDGPIKASEIKEMYPELHMNIIERCIAYLVKKNKMKLSEKSTKRASMYDVLITQEEKIVTIENIQTSIEISDQIAIDKTVGKEKEPTKKRAKSSSSPTKKKQTLQPQSNMSSSPLPSSSSSSSPPAIFLHVENTLPKCTVATPDLIDHVMTSISDAIESNDCASMDTIKETFLKFNGNDPSNDDIMFKEIIKHLEAHNKIMVVDEDIYLI